MMECTIQWNKLTDDEWEKQLALIPKSNILQSAYYAQAIYKTYQQKSRQGVIYINAKPAGLVQIIEHGLLWNSIHAVMLDRGPLWFDGFGSAIHIKLFFDAFNSQFPNRFGRKRRILPETEYSPTAKAILQQTGLKAQDTQKNYQTLWWDLTNSDQKARQSLSNGWESSLKKAQRSNLTITWDKNAQLYPWFKKRYTLDKNKRHYDGISPQFLDNLVKVSPSESIILIGKASTNDGQDIAAILILLHGQTATYQIGWTSGLGRKYCAHHLLLWNARSVLKQQSIKQLDLGGINDDGTASAKGIKKFKMGTGAEIMHALGLFH